MASKERIRAAFSRIKESSGYTMIEMLVVIGIMAIILAVAVPVFLGVQNKAKDGKAKTQLAFVQRVANSVYINSSVSDTNLCTNPVGATSLTPGWTVVGTAATWERTGTLPTTFGLPSGVTTAFHFITSTSGSGGQYTLTLTSGNKYTVSMYLYKVSGAAPISFSVLDPANAQVTTQTIPASGAWYRLNATFTAASTGSYKIRVSQGAGAGSNEVYFTGCLIENSDSLGFYFPTTVQLASGDATWTGAAHASTSTLLATYTNTFPVFVTELISKSEPELNVTEGATFVNGVISVERVSSKSILLRTKSDSGKDCSWLMDYTSNNRVSTINC